MMSKGGLKLMALCVAASVVFVLAGPVGGQTDPGKAKPADGGGVLKPGDPAPDFALPAVSGDKVTLSQFRGKKNVVISFVPAAWTPVCSKQWPGYNIAEEYFDKYDAVVIGITVDNVPTLRAWISQWGNVWFPVLSDFWPHGSVARSYGVLREDGVTERALFIVDKKGMIRSVEIHEIGTLPKLDELVKKLEEVTR